MATKMNTMKLVALFFLLSLLSACGAGGGSDGGDPTPPIVHMKSAGWWPGVMNHNISVRTMIVDNGTYYHFYTSPGSNLISGVITGNGTEVITGNGTEPAAGVFSSTNGLNINFVGNGVATTQLTSNFVAKISLSTTGTYSLGNQIIFDSVYSPLYDQTPALTTVHGSYLGDIVMMNNYNVTMDTVFSLVIDANGTMLIRDANGPASCDVNGKITPHTTGGNVYDVAMTFSGNSCPNNVGSMTGNAFLDSTSRRFYVVAMNASRASGVVFVGTKQ